MKSESEIVSADIERFLRNKSGFSLLSVDYVPVIEYFTGIENKSDDSALYYISQHQNTDGSFGSTQKLRDTEAVIELLAKTNLVENSQFTNAVNYVKNYSTITNREKAVKVRVLQTIGEQYGELFSSILATQDIDTGGF